LSDATLIEEWLRNLKGQKVAILWPQKGEKARLMNMALQNAEKNLKDLLTARAAELGMLTRLQKRLNLTRLPMRIECFDNSNLSGTDPVAAMVVFENGKSNKSAYRKYKIKTIARPDDYAYMQEVLRRRYSKAEASKPLPDLLMVDGGRGQLNIALSVIKDLHLETEIEIIAIAKKDAAKSEDQDKVYKPGRVNPINFGREVNLLLFLQKIRDEAHRFAITFQRKRRKMKSMRSALDEVPGIGKKRKEVLLKQFGSIRNIRAASLQEISALPGMNQKIGEIVQQHLSRILSKEKATE
jgi:excinuclease ABC subunit C